MYPFSKQHLCIIAFSLLGIAICANARTTSPSEATLFQQKLTSESQSLAPAFRHEYNNILDHQFEFKIISGPVSANSAECLRVTRKLLHDEGSVLSNHIRYYQFATTKACLQNSQVNWQSELNREMTTWWLENLNVKFRARLVSLIYSQGFFNITSSYKLNLEVNLKKLTEEFFSATANALLMDRSHFQAKHPDAAALVQKVVFDESKNFSEIAGLPQGGSRLASPLYAKLKMLYEGNESWFMRYHLIKNAKKSIRIQSYILLDDLFGRATVALLLEALDRGVDVKMMLDGRGSLSTSRSDLVKILALHGAKVNSYNPFLWTSWNLSKFIYAGPIDGLMSSDHDKILIVDDTKLITGGRNIGDMYYLLEGEYDGKVFRDIDIYAECRTLPLSAIIAFNIEFYSANSVDVKPFFARTAKEHQVFASLRAVEAKMAGAPILDADLKANPEITRIHSLASFAQFDPRPDDKDYPIEGLDKTSSLIGDNALTKEIFKNIDEAKESITIINPYVILSLRMKQELVAAGRRGVKILILTTSPTSTDSAITQARLIGEWRSLLTDIPNLRLFGAKGPETLHAKSFVFDSKIAIVGSYNLDLLSEQVNSEFALKIESEDFVSGLKAFIEDFAATSALEYDVSKNIGPQSQANGQKRYKQMHRLTWLSKFFRPIL